MVALHWRHNDHDGVSNPPPHGCLLNRLFRRRSKKTSKLRVTGLCVGNSPGPVNSPHKGPVTRKKFPFNDVIMWSSDSWRHQIYCWHNVDLPPERSYRTHTRKVLKLVLKKFQNKNVNPCNEKYTRTQKQEPHESPGHQYPDMSSFVSGGVLSHVASSQRRCVGWRVVLTRSALLIVFVWITTTLFVIPLDLDRH